MFKSKIKNKLENQGQIKDIKKRLARVTKSKGGNSCNSLENQL